MKFTPSLLLVLLTALLGLGSGCANSPGKHQTESMLAASGFRVIPVTTDAQKTQIATLPAYRISVVKRNGQVYFVYPDPEQNQLYIGKDAQYDAYQNLLLNRQAMQDSLQASAAASNAEAMNAAANVITSEPLGFYDPWGVFPVWY